jgi:hypothetical protein
LFEISAYPLYHNTNLVLARKSLIEKGVIEMISLFNAEGRKIGTFKSFEAVIEYFNRRECLKPASPNTIGNDEKWGFVYYPHRRLCALNDHAHTHLTEIEQEAYEQKLDLIEIYAGDAHYPEQLLVTPNLDLPNLIKNWCFDYAYAQRLVLLQTFHGSLGAEQENGILPVFSL